MKVRWHMPTLQQSACGLSIRARRLAAELRRHGHDVVFCVDGTKTDVVGDAIDGMAVERLSVPEGRAWHWSLQAAERLAKANRTVDRFAFNHDVLISCQPELIGALRWRPPSTPVVFVCGGSTLLHDEAEASEQAATPIHHRMAFSIDRRLKQRNEAAAFEAADAVVFDSETTRRLVLDRYAPAEDKCITIHAGVDTSAFQPPDPASRRRARAMIGAASNEVVFVWTGRLSPEKNLAFLIKAMAGCRRRPDRLLLVGDGPLRSSLASLAAECGVDDRVVFTGSVSDVVPYLHAADAFVFPSRGESFGCALVEAMACGLPCIGLRNTAGIRNANAEILTEDSGILVSAEQGALSAALSELTEHAQLRASLGRHAVDQAGQFTWQAGGRQLDDLLADTCSRFGQRRKRCLGSNPARVVR